MNVTDKAAIATDWNVSADTHPTIYVHSNTTPATDYMTFGAHDGTVGHINVVGGTTLSLDIGGTAVGLLTAGGFVLDQAGNDGAILSLRSSDVSTGLTSGTGILDVTVNDYLVASKFAAATGGALIQAVGENAAVTTNLRIESYGGQPHTTHSAAGRALVEIYATQHDGANGLANATADSNVFAVIGRVGGADSTLMIVDEDGEIHSDGGAQAAYDEYDDVQLVRALDRGKPGAIECQWDGFVKVNEQSLVDLKILGGSRDGSPDRGLVCITRLQRLHNGAIWQNACDMMELAKVLTPDQQARLPDRMRQRLALAG